MSHILVAMPGFLENMDSGQFIGLIAVSGGFVVGIILGAIAILTSYLESIRKAEIEAALKQDMLNRGMSAEDIALVIRAKKGMKDLSPRA